MNQHDHERIIQAELTGLAAIERITRGETVDLGDFGDDLLVWPMLAAVINFAATTLQALPADVQAAHIERTRQAIAAGLMHTEEGDDQ